MPSTTKLFLGVRGTRQGAASLGRPRQKALSRPLVHPSTRHPRDPGLLALNLALLYLIRGQRLATGSRTGATGLRANGHETLGVPCVPCNSPAVGLPRYLLISPSPCGNCLDLGSSEGISCTWERGRAYKNKFTLSPSSGSPAPQLQQPSPGSHPQSILSVSSPFPALTSRLTPRKHRDSKNRGKPDTCSR